MSEPRKIKWADNPYAQGYAIGQQVGSEDVQMHSVNEQVAFAARVGDQAWAGENPESARGFRDGYRKSTN